MFFDITNKLKAFVKNNPFVHLRRWQMRRGLKNHGMSLFCPYCMGGTLFHDLGLQFCSPTINLMMYQTDFKKFILHLDNYLYCQVGKCQRWQWPDPDLHISLN